jgi:hypothetical protein
MSDQRSSVVSSREHADFKERSVEYPQRFAKRVAERLSVTVIGATAGREPVGSQTLPEKRHQERCADDER